MAVKGPRCNIGQTEVKGPHAGKEVNEGEGAHRDKEATRVNFKHGGGQKNFFRLLRSRAYPLPSHFKMMVPP